MFKNANYVHKVFYEFSATLLYIFLCPSIILNIFLKIKKTTNKEIHLYIVLETIKS